MIQEVTDDSLRTLSLCSGYGGLDLGLHRVFPNARTVCYVENEIPAAAILVENTRKGRLDDAPIWSNLKTFDPRPFVGRIDAIIGGYPCQPFSVAGKRGGTDDPRHLWPYIAELVRVIQPRICVFENVRGHVRLGLPEVLGELRSFGYRVRAGIFAASEVGAPHRRERVFILAYREGERLQPGRGSVWSAKGFATVGDIRYSRDVAYRDDFGIYWRETCAREAGRAEPEKRCRTMADSIGEGIVADSIGEGLQGHAGDEPGGHEPGRVAQGQDGSAPDGSVLDDARSIKSGRVSNSKREEIPASWWPSRPGEAQHEWEEPRTIDRKLNSAWVAQLMGLPSDWVEVKGLTREMKLRALGNGVVPQQAELAIKRLLIMKDNVIQSAEKFKKGKTR